MRKIIVISIAALILGGIATSAQAAVVSKQEAQRLTGLLINNVDVGASLFVRPATPIEQEKLHPEVTTVHNELVVGGFGIVTSKFKRVKGGWNVRTRWVGLDFQMGTVDRLRATIKIRGTRSSAGASVCPDGRTYPFSDTCD